jgi:hypothetical protein
LARRRQGADYRWQRPNGWQVIQFDRLELGDDTSAMLADLATETGAPTLCAFVLDSDAAQVDGYSGGGPWRACLARESMRDYYEDDEEEFDLLFPDPETAARAAASWASRVGRTPDTGRLLDVFRAEEADSAVEELFDALLEGLEV